MTDLVRTGYGHVIRSPEAAGEGGGCCPYVIKDSCPNWPHDFEVAETCQLFCVISVAASSFMGGGSDLLYRVSIDAVPEGGWSFIVPVALQTADSMDWTYQWFSTIAGSGTAGTHSIAIEVSNDGGSNWGGVDATVQIWQLQPEQFHIEVCS